MDAASVVDIGVVTGRDRDVDATRQYLDEIGQHGLLSRDDEVRLAQVMELGRMAEERLMAGRGCTPAERDELLRKVTDGDRARQQFVEANLRLVVWVAKRYRRPGVELLDLIQAGNMGLLRAVSGFDWRLGNRFSTYATWWIRQAVLRERGDSSRAIHLPAQLGRQVANLIAARDRLRVERGREPRLDELAEAVHAPPPHIRTLLSIAEDTVSLSGQVGDYDAELGDFIADDGAVDPAEQAGCDAERIAVQELLGHLSPHHAEVLRLRYGLDGGGPRSLEAVGQELGITRERVRQIEKRALRTLRRDSAAVAVRLAS